jgi:adenylosuccinate synthase
VPRSVAREAAIVVDLGFGDAGKGAVTDFLVRDRSAHTVVRFNGGAQAGHNVVTPDRRHHTFSQLGSGTFVAGVRTHLASTTVVHPTALLVEARALAQVGVPDALERLTVGGDALVVTPFHQAACRLRELARGEGRHGSCGVGVGEAVSDALAGEEDVIRMRHLRDTAVLRRALERTRERKRADLDATSGRGDASPAADREWRMLEDPSVADDWIDRVLPLRSGTHVVDDDWLRQCLRAPGAVVFEGAQGVLLDQDRGFHPFTTWSSCTFDAASSLLDALGYDGAVTRWGVLRTYCVRHGPGPMPTEAPELASSLPEPHNPSGPWQGAFRVGWPDLVLTRYALAVSRADALALTHLDALQRVERWQVCRAYRGRGPRFEPALFESPSDEGHRAIKLAPSVDLEHQHALTQSLFDVSPVLEPMASGARADEQWAATLADELGVAARLGLYGPTAKHARRLG